MGDRQQLTTVETVQEAGAWVCTVETATEERDELLLLACDAEVPVTAWINRCTHEDQRLYREPIGAVIRDDAVVCPRHGSHFDTCSGACDNGEAAETTLVSVAIVVADGMVYLVDDDVTFLDEGPIGADDDDMPGSTSHIQF